MNYSVSVFGNKCFFFDHQRVKCYAATQIEVGKGSANGSRPRSRTNVARVRSESDTIHTRRRGAAPSLSATVEVT